MERTGIVEEGGREPREVERLRERAGGVAVEGVRKLQPSLILDRHVPTLTLQLRSFETSESIGLHDSEAVDDRGIDRAHSQAQ